MTRRRLVALVSVAVLFTLGLIIVGTIAFLTRTITGREKVRSIAQSFIDQRVHGGTIYLGRITGSFLNGITFDSLAIRDKRGELLVSTGRATFAYDPRDILDNRLYIRRARVEHPYVHLIQHSNGVWNFKEIFASTNPTPQAPPRITSTRGWGDYIVVDSTYARDASFILTMAWQPDDSLKGSRRDSSINAHLNNPARAIVKTFDGYGRQYSWTNAHGLITHARIADPDSDLAFGRQFHIDTLSADEFEPTFQFRNVTGDVRHLGDSVWFQIPHFDMPASTGKGSGKVSWGSAQGVHYDIAIHGDSVSLDDVNWVYPTLPRTGGGKLDLLIQNDPKVPQILDFKLVNMDVKTTKSRLVGNMTFSIGAPVLLVRNLNVKADPVDFDLIRAFSTKPFPDWQGQIYGTMAGRGGLLTHFMVDDARGVFRDAHVAGAESHFSAKGELDIFNPALTAFHKFFVDVASLDPRSIEYLYPSFPRLGGIISGTATLDSSWLDVRFSNADVIHRDGPGEPSHLTGSGRITDGEKFMFYDVTLDAHPVSMTMLARSPGYKALPLRGLFSGPIRATGSSPDLDVSTSLQSASGAISFDGKVDLDTIGGMAVRGRGQFATLNVAKLLERPTIPANTLNGHYELDVDSIGDNLALLHGFASIALDRSMVDGIRVNPSQARVRFVDGQMLVDTLRLNSPAFKFAADGGGLGLPNGRPDSLRFTLDVDSLGGLRFLARLDSTLLAAALPDSITGDLHLQDGLATGRLDSLSVTGTAASEDLSFNKYRAARATIGFSLHDLPKSLTGSLDVHVDTATIAGVLLDTIGGAIRFSDFSHRQFDVAALSRNGPSAHVGGNWSALDGANDVLLSSATFTIGNGDWRLASPTHFAFDSSSMSLDSLTLRKDSATIALRGSVPDTGAATGEVRAVHVPLRDLGILAQLTDSIDGVGDMNITVTGTKLAPVVDGRAALSSIKWAGLDITELDADGRFRDKRLNANGTAIIKGQQAVTAFASLPIDLSLFSAAWGRDTLYGFVGADSADLSLVQALVGKDAVRDISGRIRASVRARGTPQAKTFDGDMTVSNGSVFIVSSGVTLSNISGRLSGGTNAAGVDSIRADLSASTETKGRLPGRLEVRGSVTNLLAAEPNFNLALGLNQFHALNRRSLADLYITADDSVRLTGPLAAPKLEGALTVDHTSIFLPDPVIARKQPVLFATDDTASRVATLFGRSTMFSQLMFNLVSSVPITLGNDVRLRSKEANVRLSGNLHVAKSSIRSTRTLATGEFVPGLTLEGALRTEGGTYNLDLGLVQREFQVLSGGTVTFTLADSWKNPTLDIKAKHTIKQVGGDLGVIVNLHGPLIPYPEIFFSSTGVDYEIPTSDLLSYLLTGKPGFDFLQNPASAQVLASFLAPTVSAFAADRLRQSLGSWSNVLQLQLGGTGSGADQAGFFSSKGLGQYFYGATVAAEQQFGDNLFLSVNTGFCQFSENNAGGARLNNALSNVGAKVEYRVRGPKLAVQLAYDPATEKRTCTGGQSTFGLAPAPPNFSFSLSHVWRF